LLAEILLFLLVLVFEKQRIVYYMNVCLVSLIGLFIGLSIKQAFESGQALNRLDQDF